MAPGKRRPGDKRRRKASAKRGGAKAPFTRPREWAEQELIGVKGWITRLEGEEGDTYPQDWRNGMIRHYRRRARQLRGEISTHRRRERSAKVEGEGGSPVA